MSGGSSRPEASGPIAIATGLLTARLLDRDKGIGLGRGADVLGALLIVSSLMLGVYAIVGTSDHGWGSINTIGFGGAAIALLVGFVVREMRTGTPLVPLRIFRSRSGSPPASTCASGPGR